MSDVINYILGTLIAFGFLWIARAVFVAPYKLLREERAKNEKKVPDLQSLYNAIQYIRDNTKFGQLKPFAGVFAEVIVQTIDSQMEITGRLKHPLSPKANNYYSVVPADFLKSCIYVNEGDLGTLALKEITQEKDSNLPGNTLTHFLGPRVPPPRIYYEPVVSMRAIKRVFDDR